jgi:hypothetical protein
MSDSIRDMRQRAAMLGAPGIRKCGESLTEEERCRLHALDDVEAALHDNGYGAGRELSRLVGREKSTVQQWLSGAEHMKQFPLWALYKVPAEAALSWVEHFLARLPRQLVIEWVGHLLGKLERDSLRPTGTGN